MATDLGAVLTAGKAGFWSWLVTGNGSVNELAGGLFVNLLWGLVAFLLAVIFLEAIVVWYAYKKIDLAAAEVLSELS